MLYCWGEGVGGVVCVGLFFVVVLWVEDYICVE